ncbi:hypothetical protein SAMN05444166_3755 [Singulisphaera sp. GP187]|nr:hypothetical protein SAMN05444166_3755 [Singulisphaera sp. GP187]
MLEGLEGRTLQAASLTAAAAIVPANARLLNRENGISVQDRRMSYTTPQGTRVIVTLYGVGSLAGSTVDPDGALNVVFSDTGPQTGIVAKVSGGTRRATLRSIHHKDLNPDDLSGIGSSLLNVVNFKDFDLVDNGRINLTGGVHAIYLNSVGRNTQINLREEPIEFLSNDGSTLPTSTSSNGVNLAFITNLLGASTLTSVGGQFVADFNSIANHIPTGGSATIGVNPGPPPAPPGVVAVINHIKGAPRSTSGIEDPQVFGLDSTTHTLIRFDATTGAALQTIPLTGMGTPNTGVALGRNAGRLVALVGDGTSIRAFDAVTGDPVGQFTTTNLGSLGLTTIDGIGSTDTRTVISDSTAGAGGLALQIDVTASLATGHAVAVGQPYPPQRQFELSGGLASVPATHTMFATGAAHFDTFQPNLVQFGVLSLNTGDQLSETARTPLKQNGNFVNAGPEGSVDSQPPQVLGSVDQNLALVTGVANGKNVVSLLNPQTLASNGTLTLNNPNPLTGLSESFRPDLANSALIDVQGNVQSLRAKDATGLVFNVAGYINLAKINRATDSLIIGQPFGHAEIPKRSHVDIISSPRPVDGRNGVQVNKNLKQIGPLSLPGR